MPRKSTGEYPPNWNEIAVNIISLEINRHYPAIPQEQRRELAARAVEEERRTRKHKEK